MVVGIALWLLLAADCACAAVFQYMLPITTTKAQSSAAFLWIPPDADQLRGIVVCGTTLMESDFVRDPRIREACKAQKLAIVIFKCGLGVVDLQRALYEFGNLSGYAELPQLPLLFVGHSAGGPQAKALAAQFADRCFGLIQYRGGTPAAETGGGAACPAEVPSLMMLGQFDEFGGLMRDESGRETWEGGRDALRKHREENEARLAGIVVEPGAGHFAWSDRNAKYLTLWIAKAAEARIPTAIYPKSATPVHCKRIDCKGGWLADLALNKSDFIPASSWAEYKGKKDGANWLFDQQMADATSEYHQQKTGGLNRRDQFIVWKDPTTVDAGVRRFFNQIDWCDDGQTFEVHPLFSENYPATREGAAGPRWFAAGKPVEHAAGEIAVKAVGGPVISVGLNRLRIQHDALFAAADGSRVTFSAFHPGDDQFRHTEQVGMLPKGFKGFKDGKDQSISFPPIGNPHIDGPPLELKASSDAELPVEYYVAFGPAVVADGKLRLAEVPRRAHFPIQIKVVAYQFGRGVSPLVKSATPVEQAVQLEDQAQQKSIAEPKP